MGLEEKCGDSDISISHSDLEPVGLEDSGVWQARETREAAEKAEQEKRKALETKAKELEQQLKAAQCELVFYTNVIGILSKYNKLPHILNEVQLTELLNETAEQLGKTQKEKEWFKAGFWEAARMYFRLENAKKDTDNTLSQAQEELAGYQGKFSESVFTIFRLADEKEAIEKELAHYRTQFGPLDKNGKPKKTVSERITGCVEKLMDGYTHIVEGFTRLAEGIYVRMAK